MSKYTKLALGESLKRLLQKKPLSKITITEIVEDCGLNRMTFYYHFKDIYDLLEWVCVEDAEKALAGRSSYLNWQEGLANIFKLILDNRSFVINAYQSMPRDYLERYIYRLTDALFISVIDELDKGKKLTPDDKQKLKPDDKEFIASFYKYAFLGIMLNWIDNGMKEDPSDIITRLSILVEGDLSSAVERFSVV